MGFIFNNEKFKIYKRNKHDIVYLCCVSSCTAKIRVNDNKSVKILSDHNHESTADQRITEKFQEELKNLVISSPTEPIPSLYTKVNISLLFKYSGFTATLDSRVNTRNNYCIYTSRS